MKAHNYFLFYQSHDSPAHLLFDHFKVHDDFLIWVAEIWAGSHGNFQL